MTEREAKAISGRLATVFPDAAAIEHFGGVMSKPPHFKWPPGWKVEFRHGNETKTVWTWQHAADYASIHGVKVSKPKERVAT